MTDGCPSGLMMFKQDFVLCRIIAKALAGSGHPRRGANYTRNGISCKWMSDMLHKQTPKSKALLVLKIADFRLPNERLKLDCRLMARMKIQSQSQK
jgi:hypothetical protein